MQTIKMVLKSATFFTTLILATAEAMPAGGCGGGVHVESSSPAPAPSPAPTPAK